MKQCSKCRVAKLLTEFHADATKPGGIARQCKACKASTTKAYQAQDSVRRRRLASRLALLANPEKKAQENARAREWEKSNPEKFKARRAAWAKSNPDKVRAKVRARCARDTRTMHDRYIAKLLASDGKAFRHGDIPKSLISLKRSHLQLTRQLKESARA